MITSETLETRINLPRYVAFVTQGLLEAAACYAFPLHPLHECFAKIWSDDIQCAI